MHFGFGEYPILYLWMHGTRFYEQPFSYFGTILSLSVFIFIWYVIIAIKEVLDNDNQTKLW